MKIPEHFLSSLLARIDLVELIGKKINLRLVGANYVGLCPFHQEKTPSFTVNKSKQFFHCFGCQEHGDAIKFVMLTENTNFVATVQNLSERYGMLLEQVSAMPEDPIIKALHQVLDIAVDYYHQNLLKNTPKATRALNYLIEQRKLDLTTIRFFKLGLAEDSWTGFFDFCKNQASSLGLAANTDVVKLLESAGLILHKNHKYYDRFRDRIMFPIKNRWGKMIGFGARGFNSEQQPKYLNSPDTPVFAKNKELYGLSEIKTTLKNVTSLIVVEGYLDYVMLWQAKIYNVVATLGTALNEYHLKVMLGITSEIIFCFDGDLAGSKASIRAMEIVFKLLYEQTVTTKHTFKFALLPAGHDPDSLLKTKGATEFKNILMEAQLFSDFFFGSLLKKYPGDSVESLNKLAQEAKSYILKLPDIILRDLWLEKLAKTLRIDSSIVKVNLHRANAIKAKNVKKQTSSPNCYRGNNLPMVTSASKALAMLLLNPSFINYCEPLQDQAFSKFILPADIELLLATITAIKELNIATELNVSLLKDQIYMKLLEDKLGKVDLQKLLLIDPHKIVQLIPKSGMEPEFIGAVKQVKRILSELVIDELLKLAKNRNLTTEEKLQLQQRLCER